MVPGSAGFNDILWVERSLRCPGLAQHVVISSPLIYSLTVCSSSSCSPGSSRCRVDVGMGMATARTACWGKVRTPLRPQTTPAGHTYCMKKYDETAAGVLEQWTETEFRAAVGAEPHSEVKADNEFNPRGPHRWFAEAIAFISAIIAMRKMSETWKVRPSYLSWRSCSAGIRQKADDWITNAKLLPGTTLAQWFHENEPLLQRDPTPKEPVKVVAVALLPLFQQEPRCHEAMQWIDDDTHGSFTEYLQDWHARVPETHRSVVQRIAGEFGLEIEEKTAIGSRRESQDA